MGVTEEVGVVTASPGDSSAPANSDCAESQSNGVAESPAFANSDCAESQSNGVAESPAFVNSDCAAESLLDGVAESSQSAQRLTAASFGADTAAAATATAWTQDELVAPSAPPDTSADDHQPPPIDREYGPPPPSLRPSSVASENPSPDGGAAADGDTGGGDYIVLQPNARLTAARSSAAAADDSLYEGGGRSATPNSMAAIDGLIDYPPAFPECVTFDRRPYAYSVDSLAENVAAAVPAGARSDRNLMAADLMSSETMNDFFDEMYEANARRRHRRQDADDDHDRETRPRNNFGVDEEEAEDDDDDRVRNWYRVPTEGNDLHPASRGESMAMTATKSNLKRHFRANVDQKCLPYKKPKKGITFDSVNVYYFPRAQGFICIPSQGGSTLGMSWNHSHSRKFSLGEYAAEQRRAHKQLCSQQLAASRNWNELSNVSSEDSDSDEIISDSEVDYENYNFLQPIPTRERRAMLRAAGVHKIDSGEKDECRTIRLSREFCGCSCQVHCDPERCVCAQAGIKCQVDRMNFPCSCTREGCANENGRVEFNPVRVRTHYIHTLMRLEMEKKQDEDDERNRLILGNLKNASHLSYHLPSLSSDGGGGADLPPFSYHHHHHHHHHNGLSYYPPPLSYDVSSMTSSAVGGAFSTVSPFGYGGGDGDDQQQQHQQFVVTSSTNESGAVLSYSQLSSVSGFALLQHENASALAAAAAAAAAAYSTSADCLLLAGCEDGSQLDRLRSENFRSVCDAIAAASSSTAAIAYDVDPSSSSSSPAAVVAARLSEDDELNPDAGRVRDDEGSSDDGRVEVGDKETEKDESDSENFGDIIKKTMVESVIG